MSESDSTDLTPGMKLGAISDSSHSGMIQNLRFTRETISADETSVFTSCLALSVTLLTYLSKDERKNRIDAASAAVRPGYSKTLPTNFDPVLVNLFVEAESSELVVMATISDIIK